MGFGNFKTASEVAIEFNLKIERGFFTGTLPFDVPEHEMKRIKRKIDDPLSFLSEEAICERIISPILDVLEDHYQNLRVWSHITYNVDPSKDLSGRPDFLVAPPLANVAEVMDVPPLCVIEAKDQDWKKAWAQALAEMYAASTQGATICYAVVTSGEEWQFGKFEKEDCLFIKEKNKLFAVDVPDEPDNLQKLFNKLNWVFNEVSKVIIEKYK
ncbi:MAG: hypothetical protein DRR08_30105 [Candidatus Parabeggiatoa sp. nov. 2]|nr:MAG: hypothetical protein B6247_23585 [Beggiatoa sp. 4572_84]RKZ50608.1 MAG: hypothetical protein DRR08_30105 [Gammaproteobacteria bacterium]